MNEDKEIRVEREQKIHMGKLFASRVHSAASSISWPLPATSSLNHRSMGGQGSGPQPRRNDKGPLLCLYVCFFVEMHKRKIAHEDHIIDLFFFFPSYSFHFKWKWQKSHSLPSLATPAPWEGTRMCLKYLCLKDAAVLNNLRKVLSAIETYHSLFLLVSWRLRKDSKTDF